MDLEITEKLNDIITILKSKRNTQIVSYPINCYKCGEILNLTQCIYNQCPNIICKFCINVVQNKVYCDKHTQI